MLMPQPEPEANNDAAAEWARFHLFVPPLSMIGLYVIENVYIVRPGRGTFRIALVVPRPQRH